MGSITSFKVVRGQLCPGLRDGLHCELPCSKVFEEGLLIF